MYKRHERHDLEYNGFQVGRKYAFERNLEGTDSSR